MAQCFGDVLRDLEVRRRAEVDVVGDEEGTRADRDCPSCWMDAIGSEVRHARRVLSDLCPEAFELPAANVGEVFTLGSRRRALVEKDGNLQLAAALVQMVAGLTAGKKKYASVDAEMRALALDAAGLVTQLSALVARDAAAFAEVSAAYKMPNEPADAAARRKDTITKALLGAAQVPLETARACARAAELAGVVATKGNTNAASDAGVAALL